MKQLKFLRKISVKIVKALLSILPQSFVDKVKQNPRLVAAYSRNLHKSGLLYQLQTLDELKRSYADYINEHNYINNINCTILIDISSYNF